MAAVVRASCISDNVPSCMRAPPEAVKITKGTLLRASPLVQAAARERFASRHA